MCLKFLTGIDSSSSSSITAVNSGSEHIDIGQQAHVTPANRVVWVHRDCRPNQAPENCPRAEFARLEAIEHENRTQVMLRYSSNEDV